MTVYEVIEMLKGANPDAPVAPDYCGFMLDADLAGARNGRVCIKGS